MRFTSTFHGDFTYFTKIYTKLRLIKPKIDLIPTEIDASLVVFFPICKDKHSRKESRVNSINLCNICDLEHSTGHCPELPRLKVVLKESSEEVQSSYFIASRKPWQP